MSDIVTPLIDAAQGYASNALAAGVNAMNGAIGLLEGLGRTISNQKIPVVDIKIPSPEVPGEVPLYTGSHFSVDPFSVVTPTLLTIPAYQAPTGPGNAPTVLPYNDPIQPSGEPDASLLQGAPTINTSFVFPTMPDLEGEIAGIIAPVIIPITIPAAPNYSAPTFSGQAPVFNAVQPTGLDDSFRANYATISPVFIATVNTQLDAFLDREFPGFRSGMAAIETRLATYLSGGTALTPAVENAIVNRTLAKTNADAKRAAQESWGKAARAGFTVPTPLLLSQQQDIDQSRRAENAKAATEIAVKQAELEQSNLQFAVKQSTDLRKIAIDAGMSYYTGLVSINQQAIEYARNIMDAVVKAFDIAARYAEVQARIYEADANVYRAQLDGALAVLKAYESTVRGLEAQATVNKVQIEAYTARIQAVQAEANVFRAAVDAVVAEAGLQRILVELYDSKVKAYGSEVNAYTARWNGYAAAVKGQEAKMAVSVAQARVFGEQVTAFSAQVSANAKVVEIASKTNEQLVNTYKAQVEAYGALEHAKAESVHIDVEAYTATLASWKAGAEAITEKNKATIAQYELAFRGLVAESHIILELLQEQHKLDYERVQGVSQVSQTIGRVYGDLAMSAMSGMNTLTNMAVSSTV
jgi:hypothetical protein